MSGRAQTVLGFVLAGVGLLVVVTDYALHIVGAVSGQFTYEISHTILLTAAVIGFAGFYMIDPGHAKDGAGFVVNSAVAILKVVRGGRRSTDTRVISEIEIPPPDPPQ